MPFIRSTGRLSHRAQCLMVLAEPFHVCCKVNRVAWCKKESRPLMFNELLECSQPRGHDGRASCKRLGHD